MLLLVSRGDMTTGERAATEIAWMVMATSVVACLRVAIMKLVKVLFQTVAEGTEHTKGARCAQGRRSFEGVGKGQCERHRPVGATATSMKYFDMSFSKRVNFISWRMFLFVA